MNNQRHDDLERDARESLETHYGHPLTDEEWNEATQNLLHLARTLRDTIRDNEEPHGTS